MIDDDDTTPESGDELHARCEQWALWSRAMNLCRPLQHVVEPEQLERLRAAGSRPLPSHDVDIGQSAELAALHIAIEQQPRAALDRRVFELHYVVRVQHIKVAAAALGISRTHYYRVLGDFRRRVVGAGARILADTGALSRVVARTHGVDAAIPVAGSAWAEGSYSMTTRLVDRPGAVPDVDVKVAFFRVDRKSGL